MDSFIYTASLNTSSLGFGSHFTTLKNWAMTFSPDVARCFASEEAGDLASVCDVTGLPDQFDKQFHVL